MSPTTPLTDMNARVLSGVRVAVAAVLIVFAQGARSIRFERVDVPGAVISGEPVLLLCEYNLEGAELYSVKWYKNNVEFYRYLPSDVPPGQKYDLVGLYVNLSKSNHNRVYLDRTDLNSEGSYGCEVSTEGPEFRTIIFEKDLNIYVLPERGPVIEGVRGRYQLGDVLNATCRSRPSKPAPFLNWFVNGKLAPSHQVTHKGPYRRANALQASVSTLRFQITARHLAHGLIRLRCSSSINKNHSRSSQELLVGTQRHLATEKTYEEENAPTVTGVKPYYSVGHTIDLNCSAVMTTDEIELEWFINDDEHMPSGYQTRYPTSRQPETGLRETVVRLRFVLQPRHYHNDELRLRCTATFSKLLTLSSEETVLVASQQTPGFHIAESRSGCNPQARLVHLLAFSPLSLSLFLSLSLHTIKNKLYLTWFVIRMLL
ncbi:uncharacterized protein [Dermacentor andersoni]|uniref:uncharacterized protein isoform X1 n=1 Tax=Dermacentor andersoni TaxID=34620 RepID=UPI003B3BA5F1